MLSRSTEKRLEAALAMLELPRGASLGELLALLGRRTGYHYEMFEAPELGDGMTGRCIVAGRRVSIFVKSGLSPLHSLLTVLHELAHIVLNHPTPASLLQEEEAEYLGERLLETMLEPWQDERQLRTATPSQRIDALLGFFYRR